MSIVKINKSTNVKVKFKVFNNYTALIPVDITGYVDFVCAIIEDGRTLIEKKYSTNDIDILTDTPNYPPYVVVVKFKAQDTINLNINPFDEERHRTLQLFAIDINRQPTLLVQADFYLEGTGYYVRAN